MREPRGVGGHGEHFARDIPGSSTTLPPGRRVRRRSHSGRSAPRHVDRSGPRRQACRPTPSRTCASPRRTSRRGSRRPRAADTRARGCSRARHLAVLRIEDRPATTGIVTPIRPTARHRVGHVDDLLEMRHSSETQAGAPPLINSGAPRRFASALQWTPSPGSSIDRGFVTARQLHQQQ